MSDRNKLHCLEAFADSFKIVDWIRKETPHGNFKLYYVYDVKGIDFDLIIGVNDLHKFVSVALHTSVGEGDFANDNLSRLKIIGSGYGPLIYDLQQRPTFNNFKECCMKVWYALKHTPKLPGMLVSIVRGAWVLDWS